MMLIPLDDAVDYIVRRHVNCLYPSRQEVLDMLYLLSYVYGVPYAHVANLLWEKTNGNEAFQDR